jgi:LAGLIDADG endonuclease
MLLCAGITSLSVWISFKYSHPFKKLIKVIVTMLKQRSQSAGNFVTFINNDENTSETLRDKSAISQISVHVPTHLKPINETDFGHYLAGLIDGDGHFSKTPQLVIVFNEEDASLAYYIKARIGYGNVYKVKNKKAVILVVSKLVGINKVLNLINGKIRSQNKLDQIKNNLFSHSYFKPLTHFNVNTDINLNNYWLSGFSDADASFQIKLITRNQKTEVRLNFQIDQKKKDLLVLIKEFLGGNIGYRKSQDTFYYGSTSFGSAKKVISYFDNFHLLSSKHVSFLKWRKAYTLIQNKEHLTIPGLKKITKIKTTMNRNNRKAFDVIKGSAVKIKS